MWELGDLFCKKLFEKLKSMRLLLHAPLVIRRYVVSPFKGNVKLSYIQIFFSDRAVNTCRHYYKNKSDVRE